MKLSECKEGRYIITQIPQGRCGDRFIVMGIISGSIIDVKVNTYTSPVVIDYKRTTLSIGRGMADKVIVEEI
jgi:Fe2+ transport system protein FeoA